MSLRMAIAGACVLLVSCSGGGGAAPGSSGGACDPGVGDTLPIPSKRLEGTVGGAPFTARGAYGSASSVSDGTTMFSVWIVDDAPGCDGFFAPGTVSEAHAVEARVPAFTDGYVGVVTGKCGGIPELSVVTADPKEGDAGAKGLYPAQGRIELSGAPAKVGEKGTIRVRVASQPSGTSLEGEVPFTFCLDQRSK